MEVLASLFWVWRSKLKKCSKCLARIKCDNRSEALIDTPELIKSAIYANAMEQK
jgi:hypothetical protein